MVINPMIGAINIAILRIPIVGWMTPYGTSTVAGNIPHITEVEYGYGKYPRTK